MSKIHDIKSIPVEELQNIGGKARGLHKLYNFGFNVPEAFVITDIDNEEDFLTVLKEYEKRGMQNVSVRSSATLEDGIDFSAAGQFSTFLNVCGKEELIKSCKSCLKSLHNNTAEYYSKNFLKGSGCRMNIIVQKMVDAECAGVIFSKAPMRPGFVLVEVVPGLGENLVSGKMSAQQYRVRGNDVEKIPDDPVLTKDQAVKLGADGLNAEKRFGMPMDLEWAIDKSGTIWWLQARPITISESATINELDCSLDASKFVYTTGNVGEMMPGAVTPLGLSTNMFALDWGIRKTYIDMGCATEDTPAWSFIAPYYNHVFFNMTNMYIISHCVLGATKEGLDMSICGHLLEDSPDVEMDDLPMLSKIRNTFPFISLITKGEFARKGMKKLVNSLRFDLSQGMHGIYKQIIDNFDALKMAQYYHYRASYYSGGQTNILSTILEKDFEDRDELQSKLAGCLTQIEEFESANILRQMYRIADLIIEDEHESVNFSAEELSYYMKNRAGMEVRKALEDFMERHGHRGILEPEIMSVPWRDNLTSFYSSLKSVLSSAGNEKSKKEKAWTEYADEICSRYSGTKCRLIRKFIRNARKGVCLREYTKSASILVLDRFKQAYRRLAWLMKEAGLLPDENSIYFLTQDEVGQLLAGERSLVKKALARRRNFEQQQKMEFPYLQKGIPQPISAESTDPNATVFYGTPVSRGIASGKAHIVRKESDAAKLKKGEIMVATCTDIGWSPYYSIVAGMVTEIGSALSHGVVVAREYSLPTVVNVSGAMKNIHDGDFISVDGNNGSVSITRQR